MGKITIQEIATKLTDQNGLSKKEATLFVNMMFETIREALEQDKVVKVKGLGTFKIIDVDPRESVNVNTGERVLIEGHNKITFTPDALIKELVNKPFSQFETIVLNDGVDFKDVSKEELLKAAVADVDAEDADEDIDIEAEDVEDVVPEVEAEPEPEPVVEPEPIVEPEPVVEPEPIVEPEPEPVVEPEPIVEPELEPVVEPKTEEDESAGEMGEMPLVNFAGEEEQEETEDEDIPEWVIEPYETHVSSEKPKEPEIPAEQVPIVEIEPTPDPVVEPEPEPIIEPEPVVEPEPEPEPEPIVEAEPEPEPEPEPVVEPAVFMDPERMVEPQAFIQPDFSAEPEPVVEEEPEPKPIVEPKPVVTPEPVVEDKSEPVVEEKPEPEAPAEVEEEETEYVYDEEEPSSKRWLWWLLACVLALGIGYLLGSYFPYQSQTASKDQAPQVEETVDAQPVPPVVEPVEDVEAASEAEVTEEVQEQIDPQKLPEPQKQAEPQKQVEPQKQPEAKSPEMLESEKYDAMDPRVRLGAYRIIGLSRVEKAKEGDDLRRIAKRVLGPDMECYLEVYNNMKASTPLKAGQDIKIPKLQWKKKKTVQK